MHKFRVLLEYQKGNLKAEDACNLLSTTPRTLNQLATLWGDRLKHITPIVDRLIEPVNTKNDQAKLKEKLAELLGTTYRQVNRVLKSSNIDVPAPQTCIKRLTKHETARNRRKMREKYALDVISGLSDAETAAESAEITKRHMYRLVGQLLSLENLVYLDLRRMHHETRKSVADKIEKELGEYHVQEQQ